MKYLEILQFNPIVDVIQFNRLSERDYQLDALHNFVYPDYFLETILPEFVKNMVFGGHDQKGIQVIGSYGTGKSHLMGLVQLVAENADNLAELRNEQAREIMQPIAGKFMVHRFELQHNNSLWRIVTFEIQRFLDSHDIDYKFDENSLKSYGEQLSEMMAAFEDKYPDKGFILAIDEMLQFLRLRAESGNLESELPVLQALGQACNNTKFVFMFGVQELIYSAREFQFAADMLRKVKDRYRDLSIRREDVSYVVQKRLLDKTEQQKAIIREHLKPFTPFFADMHGNIEKYVNLFPVHPSYIENFEKIKLAQSQREILKTLSRQFDKIKDNDIPENEPGLITYDQYFEQMMQDASMMANPDFKLVSDTVHLVHDKIENNFEGPRRKQIPLAKRIANACGIKIIQAMLNKQNGATAETLTDDLCPVFAIMEDREFLLDQVGNCANLIVKATSGQYFDRKENDEFALRTEGGINPDQLIRDYADSLSPALRDKSFSAFMVEMLGIDTDPCRTGFDIYTHELIWKSHRITRDGYIFFGSPNEKSTTHPRQHFYMIFMPVFRTDIQRGHDTDEVYFVMDGLTNEFKDAVCMHGASTALFNSAPTEQKTIFRDKMQHWFTKARDAFKACYLDATKIYFNGDEPKLLRSFSLPGAGTPLLEIFDSVAGDVLESAFADASPNYPAFTAVRSDITNSNRERFIRNAIAKAVKPDAANSEGEAVLLGLKLFSGGQLNADTCDFANSLIDKLEEKGEGMVLNRDEIIVAVADSNESIWRTLDFNIEADLEFVVLTAMVQLGLIEIKLSNGSVVNASNVDTLRNVDKSEYFMFSLIKKPQGINIPLVRRVTKSFIGQDLSNKLDFTDTFATISNKARELAAQVATFQGRMMNELAEITIAGEKVFGEELLHHLRLETPALKGFYDQLATYTSKAKIRNLQIPLDRIARLEEVQKLINDTKLRMGVVRKLSDLINYLTSAKQYVPAGSNLMTNLDRQIEAALAFDPVNSSEQEVNALQTSLAETKQAYIDYFLLRYNAVCLNDIQQGERNAVLNSSEYRVCQILRDCTILNPAVFTSWLSDFTRLRVPQSSVNSDIQNFPNPISGFNPISSIPSQKTITGLRQELENIYRSWHQDIIDFLNSQHTQDTLKLLKEEDRSYAQGITSGLIQIDSDYSARTVIEFIKHVSQDLEEVEITPAVLNEQFSRAMSVDEFTARMDRLVMNLIGSKKRDKVRIIFRLNNSDNE